MNANNFNNLKAALVHDFLNQYGGAERVLKVLHEIFPQAPIYTLLYDKEKMKGEFKDADIRTSFLQKFPRFLRKRHKWLLPLMPTAPETFNLRGYDVVVSSSSAFAKGVVVKPKTIHICYCHSPMRYVWDWNEKYIIEQGLGNKRRLAARLLLNYIRMWDRTAADRVDYFVANSKTTQARIKKYYGRESKVIYPPVDVYPSYPRAELLDYKKSKSSALGYSEDFFLIVSRLTPYKKLEVAIEALNKLNLPLVIIGDGSPRYARYLKSIASSKTKFLGWVSDEDIKEVIEDPILKKLVETEKLKIKWLEELHAKLYLFTKSEEDEINLEGRAMRRRNRSPSLPFKDLANCPTLESHSSLSISSFS